MSNLSSRFFTRCQGGPWHRTTGTLSLSQAAENAFDDQEQHIRDLAVPEDFAYVDVVRLDMDGVPVGLIHRYHVGEHARGTRGLMRNPERLPITEPIVPMD